MSNENPAFLLAGGRPRDPAAMVRSLARALGTCGSTTPKVAYVGTANGDSLAFFTAMKGLLVQAGAADVALVRLAKPTASAKAAREMLKSSDAIFISGGEVEDGMTGLSQHGLVEYFRELYSGGKLFIGMSAGSIMMGSHWVHWDDENDDATARLFDCLGFVPTVFDTHAEDEDWKEIKVALRLLGPGSKGYGIRREGMITGNSQGTLVNLEKELICFVNRDGEVRVETSLP
jgi:peptidase E